MSILGFSIVGNPKMTFIFILGYPNPHKGALRGGGLPGGPKMKIKVILGFPTIENHRIDITHDFW